MAAVNRYHFNLITFFYQIVVFGLSSEYKLCARRSRKVSKYHNKYSKLFQKNQATEISIRLPLLLFFEFSILRKNNSI